MLSLPEGMRIEHLRVMLQYWVDIPIVSQEHMVQLPVDKAMLHPEVGHLSEEAYQIEH